MNNLAPHIEYLLMRHDCVVVPGFGAFLAYTESSRYDDSNAMFFPPSRTLGFNPEVKNGDGLLAQSIARRDGVSIDMASQRIDAAVRQFNAGLREGESLSVGSLGSFSLQTGGVLSFVPAAPMISNLRYQGLESFSLSPLPVESEEHLAPSDAEPAHPQVYFPSWLKVAASVIFIMLSLGLVYSTTNLADGSRREQASLDSGLRKGVEAVAVASEKVLPVSREILLNISRPKSDATAQHPQAETQEPARYLLVVGSFPSQRKADAYIAGNPALKTIEMDGNYRIYAASAATIDDARKQADSLRAAYPGVWICRR